MQNIPTTQQLYDSILSNLEAEFSITLNPFGRAFLVALSGVFSGILWLFYIAIGILQANIWVDTCDLVTLIRYGLIILGRNMFQATPAQYTISLVGSVGGVVPATQVWRSDDSSESPGMLYQITGGAYTMPGSSGTVTIQALEGGTDSALNIGDTLTATAPMNNVNQAGAIVTVDVVDPVDAETEALYRQNVIEKVQLVAGSWSAVDYRLLGTGISGVQQTYAYINPSNSNEVDVYLQGEIPGSAIGGTIITAYDTAIELVRPIGTFIIDVLATPINEITITITAGSFTPYTAAQKTIINGALVNFVNSVHPFIAAADNIANRNDVIATFNLNSVITGAVPGFGFSTVTFTVDTITETTYQCGLSGIGNIPFLDPANIFYA